MKDSECRPRTTGFRPVTRESLKVWVQRCDVIKGYFRNTSLPTIVGWIREGENRVRETN